MTSEIGKKYALHSNAFPDISEEVDSFVVVEVKEIRGNVPAMWGKSKQHTGLKAFDKNGSQLPRPQGHEACN
jgi:hypothetical protein